ncbi:Homeobox-leucine zipper protein ATHB-13 [Camellia lanceoleosa]|uniref:Homeobox-leucine zipper protein ATHB-13 n=1 Tax=Camellia lanceoleosa TaxID=1840588 RepID=A0ACC0GSC5_9ERIC|nr:Homeobox-leucine zipper protein ATHB-13 [Camellia lanceoleosa]
MGLCCSKGSSSNRSENSSEIKLDISTRTPPPWMTLHQTIIMAIQLFQQAMQTLFPPSIITRPTSAAVAHLFPNSSSSSRQPDHKIIDHQNAVKEESFSNMFCAIDDQSGFWPWLEQQHFN